MFSQYKAIVIDTILKELRSKTLIFMVIIATLCVLLANLAINQLLVFTQPEMQDMANSAAGVLSITLKCLSVLGFFIATIFGINIIRSDYDNQIIYQYLAFPISRGGYFFSRVLGAWLLVLAFYAYSYLLAMAAYSYTFQMLVFNMSYFYSFLFASLYLLIIIFIATFYSLFANKIGALFLTIITYVAATGAYSQFHELKMSEMFSNMSVFKGIGLFFYWLFPRFTFLDDSASAMLFDENFPVNSLVDSTQILLSSALVIVVSILILRKKDF